MEKEFYQLTKQEILSRLNSDINGLSSEQAAQIKKEVGTNAIPQKKTNLYEKYIKPVINLMIIILFLAALVQIWFYYRYEEGNLFGPIVVLIILTINILIGMRQQYKAEKTLEALKKLTEFKATVLRAEEEQIIPANQLVPGDILILKQGDYISADARLIIANSLTIDESVLTGEVEPVTKHTKVLNEENLQLQEQKNMVFSSTYVTSGNGKAIVTKTGVNTEIGQISKSIATKEKQEIPLQNKMNHLAQTLGLLVLGIIIILFGIQYFRGGMTDIIQELSWLVYLAVAAIPFNFPLITTIILLTGVLHLSRKQAIVRNLNAVETMGRLNVICSDKTGTLTAHQMTVQKVYYNNQVYDVTGMGYDPEGKILLDDEKIDPMKDIYFWNMLINGVVNNNANITQETVNLRKGEKIVRHVIGMPTEGALLTLALKGGINPKLERQKYQTVKEFAFSGERKRMSKLVERDNTYILFSKGAPEILIEISDYIIKDGDIVKITDEDKEKIKKQTLNFAQKGLRTLGFAFKRYQNPPDLDNIEADTHENGLIFSGIVGILDPPREGVKESVKICKEAGIDVKMITGDYPATAKFIAKSVNIFEEGDKIASGPEIQEMSDEDIEQSTVFARVTPDDKLKIVQALHRRNKIIGMTGDGVNDALALENADVGIAMGMNGTDVAKNAADLVLTDDSFNTIETALYHGRGLFNNIRSNIIFLLVCNLVELALLTTVSLITGEQVFTSLQLVLFYGTIHFFPPLGLMFDKYDKSIMKMPPKKPNEKLINKPYKKLMILQIITIFSVMVALWFVIQYEVIPINEINQLELNAYNPITKRTYTNYVIDFAAGQEISFINGQNQDILIIFKAQTMCFITLFLSESWVALEARSINKGIFNTKTNLLLYSLLIIVLGGATALILVDITQRYLLFIPLSLLDWGIAIGASFIPLILTEIWKRL